MSPNAVFSVSQLRACFGMQIVACGASIVNIVCTLVKMEQMPIYCWEYYIYNTTSNYEEICHQIEVSNVCPNVRIMCCCFTGI